MNISVTFRRLRQFGRGDKLRCMNDRHAGHRCIVACLLLAWFVGCHAESNVQPPQPGADRYDAVTPMPRRDDFYQLRHQRFVDAAAVGDIDLLFVGDSITHGWSGAGADVWTEAFGDRRAANFGIPGDKTQFMLWRLADGELDGIAPQAVVLMAGTNNLKSGPTRMTPPDAAAGVEAVVDLLLKRLPKTHVLLISILPRQPQYEWLPAAVREANALLADIAAKRRRVTFLDISERCRSDDGSINAELYKPDLLHLSEAGYRVWADALQEPLKAVTH